MARPMARADARARTWRSTCAAAGCRRAEPRFASLSASSLPAALNCCRAPKALTSLRLRWAL
eukprot:5896569-Lingulodinium_polyedra.AAC.1